MSHHLFEEPSELPLDLSTASGFSLDTFPDAPPEGERWSTWDGAQHGPCPDPTGSSPTSVPSTPTSASSRPARRPTSTSYAGGCRAPAAEVLMAAKRFRTGDHRLFHRDAGYLEGRRVRRSRETRAMARRTDFGKEMIAGQWAGAEFGALGELWGLRASRALPGAAGRHRDADGVHRHRAGRGRAAAGRPRDRRRDLLPDLFEQLPRRRCSSWRCAAGRTATSRRTTSCCTASGWSSSTGRRSWTSSATRAGPSSSSATATTCAPGSPPGASRSTRALLFGDLMGAATSRW